MVEKSNLRDGRILYYSVLSRLFVFTYDEGRFDGVKDSLFLMAQNPIDEISKNSLNNMLSKFDEQKIIQEFDNIFHAPPKPVRTTISFYKEGYESAVSNFEIKKAIADTHIRKDASRFVENEDNFGFLFTLMAEFIKDKNEDKESEIFIKFLNPFVGSFLESIYIHDRSDFYKDVVNLAKSFFELERIYFGTSEFEADTRVKVSGGISRSEAARREANKARRSRGSRDGI